MDEINDNLKKLQNEVTQINNVFQNKSMSKSIDYDYYINLLDVSLIRFMILFCLFYSLVNFIDPDFCYNEIVNEQTYFKERTYNRTYAIATRFILSLIILYFTYNFNFIKK